jgi:hypothetical protein
MTEEQFNLLLAEIKEVKKDLAEIKKNMVTGDESLAASGTLQQIAENLATSAAAKAEDKAEAGFTILSSLFIGLENRIMNRFDLQDEQIQAITETLQNINGILSLMVKKDEQQDATLGAFDQRLQKQEETTFLIQKKLKESGGTF